MVNFEPVDFDITSETPRGDAQVTLVGGLENAHTCSLRMEEIPHDEHSLHFLTIDMHIEKGMLLFLIHKLQKIHEAM